MDQRSLYERGFSDRDELDYEAKDGYEGYSDEEYYTQEHPRDRDYRGYEDSDSDKEDRRISTATLVEIETILCKDHGKSISADCSRCKLFIDVLGGPQRCQSYGLKVTETYQSLRLQQLWGGSRICPSRSQL